MKEIVYFSHINEIVLVYYLRSIIRRFNYGSLTECKLGFILSKHYTRLPRMIYMRTHKPSIQVNELLAAEQIC